MRVPQLRVRRFLSSVPQVFFSFCPSAFELSVIYFCRERRSRYHFDGREDLKKRKRKSKGKSTFLTSLFLIEFNFSTKVSLKTILQEKKRSKKWQELYTYCQNSGCKFSPRETRVQTNTHTRKKIVEKRPQMSR